MSLKSETMKKKKVSKRMAGMMVWLRDALAQYGNSK
jgi:hypothetical protein